MRILRLTLVLTVAVCAAAASPAAAQTWAPADSATIRPGNQTFTEGGQCTSNFVFSGGGNVYIGQAAHCAGTDGATATNGCEAGSHPLGTPVEIEDATQPGTLVYSSWIAMQQAGETDANTCGFNDFALVQVHPADAGSVNPTIPFWGGPTGIATTTAAGDKVLSYGNSSLRFGAEPLKPKEGVSLGANRGGWNHQVYTVTPGIPGDSGSAFIDRQGRAFGTLSTLQAAPAPASNGVSDVSREIDYMRSHGGPQVTLATGTEPFAGPLLP